MIAGAEEQTFIEGLIGIDIPDAVALGGGIAIVVIIIILFILTGFIKEMKKK